MMQRKIFLRKEVEVWQKMDILFFKGCKGINQLRLKSSVLFQLEINYLLLYSSSLKFLNLYEKLILNIIRGVCFGFNMKLKLIGLGYSFEWNSILPEFLLMNLGLSHKVKLKIPNGLVVVVRKKRFLFIAGDSLEKVTTFGALVRSFKKPDVYKGKGVRKQREQIILQIGKRV